MVNGVRTRIAAGYVPTSCANAGQGPVLPEASEKGMLSTAAVRTCGLEVLSQLHACPAKTLPSQTTAYGSEPAEADKLLIARTNIGSALETWSTSDELIWRVNSIMRRVLARRTAR